MKLAAIREVLNINFVVLPLFGPIAKFPNLYGFAWEFVWEVRPWGEALLKGTDNARGGNRQTGNGDGRLWTSIWILP